MKTMADDLQTSMRILNYLEALCNYQDDYSRCNNLQIVGMEENLKGETWEQTAMKVTKLLEKKFELLGLHLERAHQGFVTERPL